MDYLHRVSRFIALASSALAFVLVTAPPSQAEGVNVVKWERIIGIMSPGSVVGGIQPVGIQWTAQEGKAWVHLNTGHVNFAVKGLVLANSTTLAVAGTIGVTTRVKGTLVCNGLSTAASALVDTPSVQLDPQGNTSFVGDVAIPTDCLLTTDSLAFLIRVAEAGVPAIVNQWIAVGVVRTP
jgi:hypothetical protein